MNRILLGIIFLGVIFSACKKKKETWVSPVMAPVTEAVFASGYIEAEDQFTLQASVDGYITTLPVKENDCVKLNQLLFLVDKTNADIQAAMADSLLGIMHEQASEKSSLMQQLYEQEQLAKKKLEINKTQFERMERLYVTGSVAKTDVENAKLLYEASASEVKTIRHTIGTTQQNLRQSIVSAEGEQQITRQNTNYYQVRSMGNYRVYRLFKTRGELVRKGDPLAILGDPKRKKLVLNVDESSIDKIKSGQKTLVEMNTAKGKIFEAKVSHIYPVFDESSQSYKVEVQFDNGAPEVINGTMAQANIIVAQKANVMLIPRSSLGPDNLVRIKKNKITDTIPVTTGIISNEWVEIVSGLELHNKITQHF